MSVKVVRLIDYIEPSHIPFIKTNFQKLHNLSEKTLDEYLELFNQADYLTQVSFLWKVKLIKLGKESSSDERLGLKLFHLFVYAIGDKLISINDIPNMLDGFDLKEPNFITSYFIKNINEEFVKNYSQLSRFDRLLNKKPDNILNLDSDINLRLGKYGKIPVITIYIDDEARKPFDLTKKDVEIFNIMLNDHFTKYEKYMK